ncbi:hypothetical protein K504DRAFT_75647 [Pleomassaria siparia CBS 279.74]|uniref:Uncharacterized protein n=1 Tax=Pleomassaria siparia CBS 279.74 TaxID=1314801 RepID=A0A6G1K026_9PLEO|nr:hypothetical protein K504DRAFT_75647 [Pleomassaria siparia CBS 279.74]
MQILVRGRWHAIKPWLCARYGSQIHRKARIEDWWDMNGKHFRFTDLPAELRCCVYEQVQGQYIWPACIPQVRPLQTVSDHLWHDANVQILDPGKSNIQRTNSLFRREFLKVAWEASWKHFNCTHNLDEVISRLGGAMVMPYGIRVNCLRRINMLLPMEKYFEFVGICPSHEEPFHKRELEPTSSHVRIFRHISTLVFLNFQFEMGTYSDPWTQLASSEGYDYEPACYNVLVEWFFTFAHEHLKGIPRITASGHVKHRTKTKWERIFREEYQDRRSYEMASQIRDLEAMPPRKFPPACYCPTPCHFSEVYLPHPRGVNPGVAQSFVYDD